MNLFQAKISHLKQSENGSIYRKSEVYMLEALSFTEGESNLIKHLEQLIPEYNLMSLAKTNVSDVLEEEQYENDDNYYFKAKVVYTSTDSDSGKEKKMTEIYLVLAPTVDAATGIVNRRMLDSIVDWEVPSVVKTNISDVFLTPKDGKIIPKQKKVSVVANGESDENYADEINEEESANG